MQQNRWERIMNNSIDESSKWIIAIAILLIVACLCCLACMCLIGAGLLIHASIRTAQPLPSEIVDDYGVPMNIIPEGHFVMGQQSHYDNEQPVHTVYLNSYYMDVYEVTNARYKDCENDGVCDSPVSLRSSTHSSYYDNPQFSNYPVVYVTWEQAQNYCTWRGGRLPTEAEWEKAARGGSDVRQLPWGEGLECDKTNFDQCGIGDVVEVGSYPNGASPYGLQDMMGNVWEWVSDWYSDAYYQISTDVNPLGPSTGTFKVLRGGSFDEYTNEMNVSYRGSDNPINATNEIGFRCVKEVNP
jgi:formylglycine-generating enzyme required for sulfatase activity